MKVRPAALILTLALLAVPVRADAQKPPEAQESPSALDKHVQGVLLGTATTSVQTRAGRMQIRTRLKQVSQKDYEMLLFAACDAISKSSTPSTHLRDIVVLNRLARQGWVYEAPQKCGKLIETPLKTRSAHIILDSHLW